MNKDYHCDEICCGLRKMKCLVYNVLLFSTAVNLELVRYIGQPAAAAVAVAAVAAAAAAAGQQLAICKWHRVARPRRFRAATP